jgi:hypothetical protein
MILLGEEDQDEVQAAGECLGTVSRNSADAEVDLTEEQPVRAFPFVGIDMRLTR